MKGTAEFLSSPASSTLAATVERDPMLRLVSDLPAIAESAPLVAKVRSSKPVRRKAPAIAQLATGSAAKATLAKAAVSTAKPKVKVKTLADRPVNELWEEYSRTQPQEIRDYFWQKYFPLVRYVADKIYARLPAEVDVNDLISSGQFGLADAIDCFRLDKLVKFETYCVTRIRGAILDELRAMDWVPRLVRTRSSRLSTASDRLFVKNGERPSVDQLMSHLGLEGEERCKFEKDGSAVSTISINRKCFSSDGNKEVTEIDVIGDGSQTDPYEDTQRRDIKETLIKGLSRAERLIVTLYYYEEMTMKEIGSTLDLSESRVSQMHSSILARLKAQMQHRARELQQA